MNAPILILIAALTLSPDTGATRAPQGEHQHAVEQNGDKAMGFSHEKTTHHFLLKPDGGAIVVTANARDDRESRDQIQTHLGHIARMFAAGDFSAPMLVHSTTPPGTAVMTKLKADITYTFEASPTGGKVVIRTGNKEALAAVHEFLTFQIKDHDTKDPLTVTAK